MTLCDSTQYVHFLSATEGGRMHDKKLADEYPLHLRAGSVLRQDLGLLGHAPTGGAGRDAAQEAPEGRADLFPATL
jgi:hypothetical protein